MPLQWGVLLSIKGFVLSKRWVFTELVDDDTDYVGLIAYALYKVEKNQLAESLKKQGFNSAHIDAKVKEFHDSVVEIPKTKARYRQTAEEVMRSLVTNMENKIRPEFQGQIEKLQKQVVDKDKKHTAELAKAKRLGVESFYDAYCTGNKEGKSKWLLSALWLWSGFSGVFAAIIVAVAVYGLAAMFLTSDKREEILSSAADNIISAVAPSSPIPEVKASPLPKSKS